MSFVFAVTAMLILSITSSSERMGKGRLTCIYVACFRLQRSINIFLVEPYVRDRHITSSSAYNDGVCEEEEME